MKKLFLGAAVAVLAGTPAMAADLGLPPAAAPVLGWTGCYVGVAGGWAFGDSNAKSDGTSPTGVIPRDITGNYRVDGGIVGGTSGCNLFQRGNWVFGLEADLSWTDISGTGFDQPPFLTTTSDTTSEQWLNTDRVRIGYAVNSNWLIYATGGFALADMKYSITNPAAIVGGTVSETHTVAGWTAGAGIEWAVGSGWSVKAEYLFVDFGNTPFFNFNGLIPTAPGSSVANRNGGVFLDNNIFRVGINYKFNAAMILGGLGAH